jgi:hypothetical protein
MRDPLAIAALRSLETSAIVTVTGVLGSLDVAINSPAGLSGYDWRAAGYALAIGLASGAIKAAVAYLSAVRARDSAAGTN